MRTAPVIEMLPVACLKPHPKNPRKRSRKVVGQLARSISRFGFTNPVLIDREDCIIAGHGRVEAAKQLGHKEVPVIRLEHLSEAEAKAYMIADNKLCENAEWDEQLLGSVFKELTELELDFGLEITGFDTPQIDMLIDGLTLVEKDEDEHEPEEAEVPVPEGPAVCQPGDVWLLGRHRIICGDALQEETYQLLMEDKKAAMVFTDPPYNVSVDGHVSGLGETKHREFAMASGEMSEQEFIRFLSTTCARLTSWAEDGSIHYLCMDWRHIRELMSAAMPHYSLLKNLCVWVKDNAGMGSFYRSRHELVFVFKQGTAPHQNHFELGQHGRYRTNVWEYAGMNSFAREHGEEGNLLALHPTVKPVAMVADAIRDCSRRGEIVLDAFLGSGTTLMAAEKTGRICYGIEIDPLYVDTAIRRWQARTGSKAVHAVTGVPFDQPEPAKETEDGL